MLVMAGCKTPREISCVRMNGGVVGGIVTRAEACTASTDNGLVHPFGDHPSFNSYHYHPFFWGFGTLAENAPLEVSSPFQGLWGS
jgi:hypothetical protein